MVSGPMSDLFDDADARVRGTGQPAQDFVGLSLQCIAGQYRDGFPKNHVTSRTSAAQIVVVERRQIIVDEGIGMQHFERGSQIVDAGRQRAGHHAARLPAENRAQAFAARKHTVTHGFVDGNRMLAFARDQAFQSLIGGDASLFQSFSEHGR